MKEQFISALKEGLRVVILAVIPVLVLGLESGNLDVKAVSIVGIIAGLRFVDKFLHEKGKEEKNEVLKRGLTQI